MSTDGNGPHQGKGRPGRPTSKQFDPTEDTSARLSASLAYALRSKGIDHRTIEHVVGHDADRIARDVEGYDAAMAHLRDIGLTGIEPSLITTIRDLSHGWSS